MNDPYLEAKGNRWLVGVRMRLCDESEDLNPADEQAAESAASSCCRNTERLNLSPLSCHLLPADGDKHISRVEFTTVINLLMTQNQSAELIHFNFNLEPSVAKLVCVRTSSKGYPPHF